MVFIDQDIDVLAGYHTYSLKEVKLSNPKFLAYQMASNTWRFQIRKNVNAVKVYTISKSILKQSLIWIPSDIEQGLIVEKLDKETSQIDCILVKLKESIDLLRERKAIIINEVVTGKVKVV